MASQKLAQMRFCAQDKDFKKVTCIQSHHWDAFLLEIKRYPTARK